MNICTNGMFEIEMTSKILMGFKDAGTRKRTKSLRKKKGW